MSRLDEHVEQFYDGCSVRDYHGGQCMAGCSCMAAEIVDLRARAEAAERENERLREALAKVHPQYTVDGCSGWVCSKAEHPGDEYQDDCEDCEHEGDSEACLQFVVRCPICAALDQAGQP